MNLLDYIVGTPWCYAPVAIRDSFYWIVYERDGFDAVCRAYYCGCDREHRL